MAILSFQANIECVARAFVEARHSNGIVSEYPGALPATLHDAYEIQDAGVLLNGKTVGGWKVGRVAPHFVDEVGTDRIAGPIFADSIVSADVSGTVHMPILHGFAAVEAELMLRVGKSLPPQTDLLSIRNYISEVRLGIEIASSPFPGINEHGPAVTVSDFGNNFGLVLGPQIVDWRERDLMAAAVELLIDGKVAGTGRLSEMLDGPFAAVAFLANLLCSRNIALTPGTWISTGAITGVHRIEPGQSARATFDDVFEVSCGTKVHVPPFPNGGEQ